MPKPVLITIGALILVAVIYGIASGGADGAPSLSEGDRHCEESYNAAASKDVTAWLASPQHRFYNETSIDPGKLGSRLKQAGAVGVKVTDIIQLDGGAEMSTSLMIKLPTDAGKRKAVLAVVNETRKAMGEEGIADDGRHYAYLGFD